LETKIIINITAIIFSAFSILVCIIGYFIVRLVKSYDDKIRELFDRTEDLPAIRESIAWIKEDLREKK
jgi:hypothetical protein